MTSVTTENRLYGRLPWHKPEVQRLSVHIDTAAAPGSNDDFEAGSVFVSDVRVKKDVTRITDALQGILSLHGVTYQYKTTEHPELQLTDKPQIGFLAQELEQVYPQLVKTREDGFKAVNYAHLVPVLVEAIKEQQSMIAELQEKVNSLQGISSGRSS
jgi:hypothetical protein